MRKPRTVRITDYHDPVDPVRTLRGDLHFCDWLKTEAQRLAEKHVETIVEHDAHGRIALARLA